MHVRSRLSKPPAALFFPPPVLKRRYAVQGERGQGGCSRVFQAWDASTAQVVALKRAHWGQSSEDLLRAEADLLSNLHHPSIPVFLDYFEEEGRCYLVEEWKAGTSLDNMRCFSLPHVLWIGQQCGDVLAYLHRQQVFHGDLAPGNILLERQRLALIDFGFAFRPGDPSRPKGTPGYASPEQWHAGQVSAAGDVFSLGMLLGCALTGAEPEAVQRARAFSPLWDDPGQLPRALVLLLELLDRMIASAPAARPGLAEVQDALLSLGPRQR